MKKKILKSDMKYFLVLLSIGTFALMPIIKVNAFTSSRFYAGYDYYGYEGSGPKGVRANIYCVSPSVPVGHMRSISITTMLSYSPMYWVQIGYTKQNMFWYVIWNFYAERKDSTGYVCPRWGFPLSGHTYDFRIYKSGNGYIWKVYEGSTHLGQGVLSANPSTPVDLQAKAETSKTSISIGNTHYDTIRSYTGSSWNLWDRHNGWADYPYRIQQISHYEFKAWRG